LYAILFIFGPFCEEAGWRGFALPRLQARYGPLLGTLILGILWGMWHLPLHLDLFRQDFGSGLLNFGLLFGLATLAYAVIQTWLFNTTRGSLLLLMLAHGSINAGVNFFGNLREQGQLPESFAPYWSLGLIIGPVVFALGLIIFTGGRLGYPAAEA
jgi:membrane protease YdiL (CAAX protease family)